MNYRLQQGIDISVSLQHYIMVILSTSCIILQSYSGADPGGGYGGPMPPPSGLSPHETRRFAIRA